MNQVVKNVVYTNASLACVAVTLSGITTVCSAITLFVAAPFVPDRQEAQITSFLFDAFKSTGVATAWVIGSMIPFAYVTKLEAGEERPQKSTEQPTLVCIGCQYYDGDNEYLKCAVHPTKKKGVECRDFQLIDCTEEEK